MRTTTYSQARQNLAETMNEASKDKIPILITRSNKESCVLVPLSEYESLEETVYLLRSPKNAKRLIESIEELGLGKGTERELSE